MREDAVRTLARPPDFVVAADGRIVSWSDRAAGIFGLSAERAVGRLCAEVVRGVRPDGSPYCRYPCPWLVPPAGAQAPVVEVRTVTGPRRERPLIRIRHGKAPAAPGVLPHYIALADAQDPD